MATIKSIEEKAKAYDETIEKLRDFYRDYDTVSRLIDVKEELANLIPELKESEDGRIINNIKKVIGWYRCMFTEKSLMPEEYQEINAWLEKQGEQKPIEWSEKTKGLDELETYILSLVPDRPLDAVKVDSKNIRFLINKEQRSAEWSEQDETKLNDVIRLIENSGHVESIRKHYVDWLKSLRPQKQQQEDEWSDEDKEFLELTLSNLAELKDRYGEGYGKVGKCIDWLKSLQPQPIDVEAAIAYQDGYQKALVEFSQKHQEWTDDDINMIDWLIRCCEKEHEELCNDKYGHQDIVSELKRDCRKKWDWFESLKDKAVPQKQWKPSAEQLQALRWVCNRTFIAQEPQKESALEDLYEQLKAL